MSQHSTPNKKAFTYAPINMYTTTHSSFIHNS